MYLGNMIHHFVLTWKHMIPVPFTTATSEYGTPENSFLQGMSAVVVPMKIVPTREVPLPALERSAVKNERVTIVRELDSADI